MKKFFTPALAVAAFAVIFTALFYRQTAGLNVLLFELLLILFVLLIQKPTLQSTLASFALAATFLTAFAFVIQFTVFALLINIISFFLLTGVLIYPQAASLMTSAELAAANVLLSVRKFFDSLGEVRAGKNGMRLKTVAHHARILVIPILIVVLFLILYNVSSPYFNNAFGDAVKQIGELLSRLDHSLVLLFMLGLFCSVFFLLRTPSFPVISKDTTSSHALVRVRNLGRLTRPFLLKRELVSAKFLLITLNGMILIVNLLDVLNVWFNFEWNGSYLKQFVHEGTWLLIFSILVSIAVVLYFFRGSLNFYNKSALLKGLAIAWLVQNALLAVSVGIRNYWYISYFSLAYKRIAVLFFLLLTLYGIWTVIMKIINRRSAFYLFSRNSMALFAVLVAASLFNWDALIARYNFNHYKTAFIHFDFLSLLSDKALPDLDKTKEELEVIDNSQDRLFRFKIKYMTPEEYFDSISRKKEAFISRWEKKGFLSWNLAEYKAYHQLVPARASDLHSD
jgi:hypothetical protein